MNVILLEKVDNLGDLGAQVSVKPGFGRNFLIPSGKAVPATSDNIDLFEKRRAELEKAAQAALDEATARGSKLTEHSVVLKRKAGDEGKLFGSVGTADIAEALNAAGHDITRKEIRLPEGALRNLGNYKVDVHLHPEVNITIDLEIEGEEE